MVELSQWGPLKLGNMGGYFQGAKNLEVTATDVLDLTGTTTLAFAFEGCESLTTVPGMEAWDVSNVTLSTSNYDALLNGWSTQPVQNGVKLGAGNSRYSSAAAVARQALIDDHNWSISDGAPSSSCAICLEPKIAFGDPITT